MIRSLKIDNYRGFSHFEMEGLGQVNLLVGTNNSGKTSVLEALYLLATGGDPRVLWQIVTRRGEQKSFDPTVASAGQPIQPEADICHLFKGHEIKVGTSLSISGLNDLPSRLFSYTIVEAKQDESPALFSTIVNEEPTGLRLALSVKGTPEKEIPIIPLSRQGTLRADTFQMLNNIVRNPQNESINVQYIATDSLVAQTLNGLWNSISLTPDEDRVYKALRFIEPKIERIAPVNPGPIFGFPNRSGFKVKFSDVDQPIPIGSLGDGIWRMLALAIALSRAKNGLLLIDEIDTGLHYSVMSNMWKLIYETAKELNVQVFATTHSEDCIRSLAAICHKDVRDNSQVSIQRIEPDNAVRYTEAQIITAAEKGLEVR